MLSYEFSGPGSSVSIANWLWTGRSGDRIPVGTRFSAIVQTAPGAHPASCTMGTGSFRGVKSGRGVTLTPNPLLVPWSWKSRAIPLLPLWAVRPVQSLSACTRVHFMLYLSVMQWKPCIVETGKKLRCVCKVFTLRACAYIALSVQQKALNFILITSSPKFIFF